MKRFFILSVVLALTMPIIAQNEVKGKYFTYETSSLTYISINSDTISFEGKHRGIVQLGDKIPYSEVLDYYKKIFCPALKSTLSKDQLLILPKTNLVLSVDFNNQGEILRIVFNINPKYKDIFPEEVLFQLYQQLMKIKFDMSKASVDDRYLDKNGRYDYANCFFHLYKYPCD